MYRFVLVFLCSIDGIDLLFLLLFIFLRLTIAIPLVLSLTLPMAADLYRVGSLKTPLDLLKKAIFNVRI